MWMAEFLGIKDGRLRFTDRTIDVRPDVALTPDKENRDQYQSADRESGGVVRKRPEVLHAQPLCHKARSPYRRCYEKKRLIAHRFGNAAFACHGRDSIRGERPHQGRIRRVVRGSVSVLSS